MLHRIRHLSTLASVLAWLAFAFGALAPSRGSVYLIDPYKFGIQPNQVSGLQLWLKADSESYSDGASVTTATDRSGNSRNFTEATNPPTYKTSIINGKAVYRFDGTNDRLVGGTTLGSFITSSEYTLFVVFKATAIGTAAANPYDNDAVICDGTAASYFGMHLHSTAPTGIAYNYDGSVDSASVTVATGTAMLLTQRHTGGNLGIAKNGDAEITAASGNTSATGQTPRLGTNYNGAQFFEGDIAEVAIYNAALSAGDLAALKSYFRAKYALW